MRVNKKKQNEEKSKQKKSTPLLTRDFCCLAVSQSVKSVNEENKNNTSLEVDKPEREE